jgi:hypothetical protein
MRRVLLALAAAGLIAATAQPARAADDEVLKHCQVYAAETAMPLLMRSYEFSPRGYGQYGFAPLTYPFGAGPYGTAALFGGPGVPFGTAPAFGPLGPGLTANNLARSVIAPAGITLNNMRNLPLLSGLAGLQQGEQINLFLRYLNSSIYQDAAAINAAVYAGEAALTLENALTHCMEVMAERERQGGESAPPAPSPAR